MADRGGRGGGGGGGYRGSGRGGPRRDNDRHRDSNRDRDPERPQDRARDADRGGDTRDRHHASDRDRVHKPSRGAPRGGIGFNTRNQEDRGRASASPAPDSKQPPRGPRVRKYRPSPERTWQKPAPREDPDTVKLRDTLNDDDLSEDEKVARVMGFKKFRTTKNTKIPGNEFNYAVRKEKQTMYRQYMNRQGGFNRPLSPG